MAYLPAQGVQHELRHIYRGKADSELGEPSTSFTKGTSDVGNGSFQPLPGKVSLHFFLERGFGGRGSCVERAGAYAWFGGEAMRASSQGSQHR